MLGVLGWSVNFSSSKCIDIAKAAKVTNIHAGKTVERRKHFRQRGGNDTADGHEEDCQE